MATDPVRRIRRTSADTAIELDLHNLLDDFAAIPASTSIPYLTVSLDLATVGSVPGRTPARTILDNQLGPIINSHEQRSDARASLEADRVRLNAYLDSDLDPSVTGLYVVACSAHEIFETVPLGLSVETRIAVGPTPNLSILAHVIDDHPTFAVLLADQQNASLNLYSQATRNETVTVESSGYPRRQQKGALNQRRYQARADERISAFARVVAAELQSITDELDIDQIIIAGDEVITSALSPELHQTVAERVIATVRLDMTASDADILAVVEPLVVAAEREQESVAVSQLANRIGADDRAVAGIDGVLRALQQGSVRTLLLNDDLEGAGWADFTLNIFGSGPIPTEHPTGGTVTDLVAIDLDEELVRLAVTTGATVQFVRTAPTEGETGRSTAATQLDQFSGTGALLRFDI